MRKYSVNYSDDVYNYLLNNSSNYTIRELSQQLKDKYNIEIDRKKLAQYCIKMKIKYKYECKNKSHSNKPSANGRIAVKKDGDMLKVKVSNHKWEYLQRKVYEDYYNVKLPKDVYVIFLNQNKRDFDIKNLKAISRRKSAIMVRNELFSCESKVTKLGILTASLREKIGE